MTDKSPRPRKHKKRKKDNKNKPGDDGHGGRGSEAGSDRRLALPVSSSSGSSSDSAEDSVDGPSLAESLMPPPPLVDGKCRVTSAQEKLEKARAPLQQLRDIIEVKLKAKAQADNVKASAMENGASPDEGAY